MEAALEGARAFKEAGNHYFRAANWTEALGCYRDALASLEERGLSEDLPQENAAAALRSVLEANCAEVHLREELYQRAFSATQRALVADPSNLKASFRQAVALDRLKRPGDALRALQSLHDARSLGGVVPLTDTELDSLTRRLTAQAAAADLELAEHLEDVSADRLRHLRLSFNEICDKYNLRKEPHADHLADLLTSPSSARVTPEELAERYSMDLQDAETFMEWICKSCQIRDQLRK